MKGDFSRISFDPSKHYVGTFIQQGRVQLDSDWNENVEALLHLIREQSRHTFGEAACLQDSFRIGKDIPIDHLVDPGLWKPLQDNRPDAPKKESTGSISLTTTFRPRPDVLSEGEKGSLYVENCSGIWREFDSLDLSRFESIYVWVKLNADPSTSGQGSRGGSATKYPIIKMSLYSQIPTTSGQLARNELLGVFSEPPDASGFRKVRFYITENSLAGVEGSINSYFDLSKIQKISIDWSTDESLFLGVLSAEPFILIVSADPRVKSQAWASIENLKESASKELTLRNGKQTILKRAGAKELRWSFSKARNFASLNSLRFYMNKDIHSLRPKLFLEALNSSDRLEFDIEKLALEGDRTFRGWYYYKVSISNPQSERQSPYSFLSAVKAMGIANLPPEEFLISEILGEINFREDFLICGNADVRSESAMYVDGLLCQKGHFESYLTQTDSYPSDSLELGALANITQDANISSKLRRGYDEKPVTFLVYADVWQRGISHIEDPTIREVALGGIDTSTRLKTICQVKIREIADELGYSEKVLAASNVIKKMLRKSSGTLSTIAGHEMKRQATANRFDAQDRSENRLVRIQIHDSGDERNAATFKWSYDNAATSFPVNSAGINTITFENVGDRSLYDVFKIGSIIEIIDDRAELSEEPKGVLGRITDIDLDNRSIKWEPVTKYGGASESSTSSTDQTRILGLERYRKEYHPKVILWNGVGTVRNKRGADAYQLIPLVDEGDDENAPLVDEEAAVRIRFDQGTYRSGDYWVFAIRSKYGVIDELNQAPPRGNVHSYAALALIRKQLGKEIEVIADLRNTFSPIFAVSTASRVQTLTDNENLRNEVIAEILQLLLGTTGEPGLQSNKEILRKWHEHLSSALGAKGPSSSKQAAHNFDDFLARQAKNIPGYQGEGKSAAAAIVPEPESASQKSKPMQVVECPKCKTRYPVPEYQFCTKCGIKLPKE